MFLVINVGSTSVKTCLFNEQLNSLAQLDVSHNADQGWLRQVEGLMAAVEDWSLPADANTEIVINVILGAWRNLVNQHGLILTAMGHRIVHGGERFNSVTLLTDDILSEVARLDIYAPLHNPNNRLGVHAAGKIFPHVKQFAVFDTAFHRTIPEYARRYALPKHLLPDLELYRYGFHGISCQHSLSVAAQLLQRPAAELNLIILHLGGGASATLTDKGASADTSMGFSPAEGLIMGERCGDIDPMVIVALLRAGWTQEQLDRLLNHESGLRGICGLSDMRAILARAEEDEPEARLAIDMFCYRIKKYIGAYCAVSHNLTALVFTGGIGEHASIIREKIIVDMAALGFALNLDANREVKNANRAIHAASSRVPIFVIHAEEEREIARQIQTFLEASF